MNRIYRNTIYLGLFISLVLTTIFWIPNIYKSILSKNFELRNYQMQLVDWLTVGILLVLIIYGEKNRLNSLNIKKPNVETLAIGMGLGGFCMIYIFLHQKIINLLGWSPSFDNQFNSQGLSEVGPEFIFVYGVFSLFTASIAEEIIYRGYATERLMKLKQSYWLAFLLPLLAFVLMHYRKGLDHMLMVFVVGALMQFYYLKYRNLSINIIGHFFVDLLGYIGILSKSFQ